MTRSGPGELVSSDLDPDLMVARWSYRVKTSRFGSNYGDVRGLCFLPEDIVEEPEDRKLVAVKQEPEEIAYRGIVGPEDYIGNDVDAVADTIAEQSLCEEAERRRHNEELKDLLFKQTVTANLIAKEKDDE
ncbi:CDPK-related protein kinase [Hordeum vulgare]|nr:CDPK-related protein kinase [Hordeum vulgare]